MYKILLTKQAVKDKAKIAQEPALYKNVDKLVELLKVDPFKFPPPYEPLLGTLKGMYSRRINRQHRLVYMVENDNVKILSMWTHYEF